MDLNIDSNVLFDIIMSDPTKSAELMKFLKREKGAIENYKKKLESPARTKVAQKHRFESPTALWKRKAMEGRNLIETQTSDSSSSNELTVPYDELLKGVNAYVEIISKGTDHSAGAKSMVTNMGGRVSEKLTTGVTHVIFKDGSFCTYQKAKLLKAHLVSILWLEAIRRGKCRVPEKNYPALGMEQYSTSQVAQDIQKDYEEIVRDELERSFHLNAPQKVDLQKSRRKTVSSHLSNSNSVLSTKEHTNLLDFNSSSQNTDRISSTKNLNFLFKSCLNKRSIRNDAKTVLSASKMVSHDPESSSPISASDEESEDFILEINGKTVTEGNFLNAASAEKPNTKKTSSISLQTFENSNESLSKSKASTSSTISNSLLSYIAAAKTPTTNEKLKNKRRTFFMPETEDLSNEMSIVSQSLNVTKRKHDKHKQLNGINSDGETCNIKRSLLKEFAETETEKVSTEDMSSLRLTETISSRSNNSSLSTVNRSALNISADNSIAISKNLSSLNISRSNSGSNRKTMGSKKTSFSSTEFSSINSNIISDVLDAIDNDATDKETVKSATKYNTPKQQKVAITRKKSSARKSSAKKTAKTVQDNCENEANAEDSNVRTKKTKRRRLYDLTQSTEDFNLDCEKQDLNRTKANVSKVIFKKPTVFPMTPIILTARAKELLKPNKNISNSSITIHELLRSKIQTKGKENHETIGGKSNKLDNVVKTSNKTKLLTPSRKSTRIKSKTDNFSNASESNDSFPIITQLNRRSTLDFVSKEDLKSVKKKKELKVQTSIVCTRLHSPEVQEFTQIVRKLGVFFVEDEVSSRTSHLVVGESKRTVNILRAITRGCWIVRHEWLYASLEAEKWLPEEDYELTEFSPAVKQCRLQRQAFGKLFSLDIFENCGPLYISRASEPRRSDLEELVSLCKGRTTNAINRASVVVGELVESSDAVCVSEKWLLDSVMFNKKKSYKTYLLKKPDSPVV